MTDATSNGARMDGAGDAGTDGIPGTLSAFDRAKMLLEPAIELFGDGGTDRFSVMAQADEIASACNVRSADFVAGRRSR